MIVCIVGGIVIRASAIRIVARASLLTFVTEIIEIVVHCTIFTAYTIGIFTDTVIRTGNTLKQRLIENVSIRITNALRPIAGALFRTHAKTFVQIGAVVEVLLQTRTGRIDSGAIGGRTFGIGASVG